jgi:serine---pyruvate transaminase
MNFKYRLFTPGPTSVPPETLAVLNQPVHHHRTAEFRATFNKVHELLKYVFQTKENVYTITGSGTAAFEAGFVSTLAPGSKVLNVTNGKFAERWASYTKAFGCELVDHKLDYGTHVQPDVLKQELAKTKIDAVVLVHSETSTTTACDLKAIAKTVRESGDTLLIVDGITSIGAMPFYMDEWGVDVAITGSQKSLMLPPGLGYVALSKRAQAMMNAKKTQPSQYLNLREYAKTIDKGDTPFTPANTLIEAQLASLEMLKTEGIETVWKRTATSAKAFRAAAQVLGLGLFSKQPSDSVSGVTYPKGVEDKVFRDHLKKTFNIHVAAGQGSMEGSQFRVNHMGYSDLFDVLAVVSAVEMTLHKLGHTSFELGAGVAAAQKLIASA